jgi:hypothetical protein
VGHFVNRITSARTELFEALTPVLPGRVAATPPGDKPYPPPYIWLDLPELGVVVAGTSTRLAGATFPVWVSYDGAAHAQVAGLDDIVAKVWDACLRVPAARPTSALPSVNAVGGVEVRGVVVNVEVTLGALTLCLEPAVVTSPVPPEPVPV